MGNHESYAAPVFASVSEAIQPDDNGKDVFVHISAVERAGLRSLSEGQKISYEVEAVRRTGKESAANLRAD